MAVVTKAADRHTVVTTGWTNPANAYALTGDNVYATATPGKNATVNGDFGFAAFTDAEIPVGATITQVRLLVEWGMTAAVTGGTLGIQGRNNNVADSAAEVTKTTTTEAQSIFTFGTTPSITDLKTAGRVVGRIRCSKGNTSSAMTGNLDYCYIEVTYTIPSVFAQPHFRIRSDDTIALNTDSGWAAALDTNATIDVEKDFRIRFEVEETNGGATSTVYKLQYRKNGGTWTDVPVNNVAENLWTNVNPVEIHLSAQYVDNDATTNVLAGSSRTFSAGVGLEDNATPAITLTNQHTEYEWTLMMHVMFNGGPEKGRAADGDTFEFRIVTSAGGVFGGTYVNPTVTLNLPDYLIGGSMVETPHRCGPFRDGNGNLYYLCEYGETNSADEPAMLKSTNGGKQWTVVDAAGAPTSATNGGADDVECYDVVQVGTVLHIAVFNGTGRVRYSTFNTSDAASNPDTWQIKSEVVHTCTTAPTDQSVSIGVRSNGDVVITYSTDLGAVTATFDCMAYRIKPSGGSWGSQNILDNTASTAFTDAMVVMGASDNAYIAYIDHTNNNAYYKTLSSGGTLSARTQLNASGTVPNLKAFPQGYYVDVSGTEWIIFWYRKSTNMWERRIVGGTLQAERQINDGTGVFSIANNRAGGQAPVGAIAVDTSGPNIHAYYCDSTNFDLIYDASLAGAAYGTDTVENNAVTVDTITANVFTHSAGNGGAKVFAAIFDNGGGGFNGKTIYYEHSFGSGPQTYTQTHTGAMTPGGSLAAQKVLLKSLSGGATPGGVLTKAKIANKEFFGGDPSAAGSISAVTVLAHARTGSPTDPFTTASVSPTTSVVFVSVYTQLTGGAPTVVGITGLSGTWSEIRTVLSGNSGRRLSLWVGVGCTGTGTLSIDFSATPSNCGYGIFEAGGIDTTTPYVASNTKSDTPASGTSATLSPNTLAQSGNAYLVTLQHNAVEDVTPTSGQTPDNAAELWDDQAVGAGGIETNYLIGWTSGVMGGSWASSTANTTIIGVELAASGSGGSSKLAGGSFSKTFIPGAGNQKTINAAITPGGQLVKQMYKTLTGAMTPSGVLTKIWGKVLVGSITPGGTFTKIASFIRSFSGSFTPSGTFSKMLQRAKDVAGSITPSGALSKFVSKDLAGSITPAGTFTQLRVRMQTLAGAITPSGALVKSLSKTFTGAMTPAGQLLKFLSKVFAGALTPSATFTKLKVNLKTFAGAITPAGAFTKLITDTYNATIGSTGALVKQATKTFNGTITPAGAFLKQYSKTLAGSVASSATFTKVRSTTFSGVLFPSGSILKSTFKNLAGSITPTATFSSIKGKLKQFAASITPSAVLTKLITPSAMSGSISPIGIMYKVISRVYSGAITPAGVVTATKVKLKVLAGSITPAASLAKQTAKALAGAITPTGALSKLATKTFSGTINPVGVLNRTFARLNTGFIQPVGTLVRQAGKSFAGNVTPAGTFSRLKVVLKTLAGSVSSSGTLVKQARKVLNAILAPTGDFSKIVFGTGLTRIPKVYWYTVRKHVYHFVKQVFRGTGKGPDGF